MLKSDTGIGSKTSTVKNEEKCAYNAPLFAFERTPHRYGIVQGCCNHWDCPRCGQQVAAQHYGRIVEGARQLEKSGAKLAFMTLTCRGKELSSEDAFAGYLSWTNRLLDAMRLKARRAEVAWAYCQVTEKQKRSHPHSHVLITYVPDDTVLGFVEKYDARGKHTQEALRSDWLQEEVIRSGLGEQYDLSEVETVEAASRYVAKYMFKSTQFTTKFPKNWHRVRYSRSWPKLAERATNAEILLTSEDWFNLAKIAVVVDAQSGDALKMARRHLSVLGVIVVEMSI
jgi:hypothetical protein